MVVAVAVGIVVLVVAVVAVSVWLSRRSPAALSAEGPSDQPAAGGQDRPAGPDAEAMSVDTPADEIPTGAPPTGARSARRQTQAPGGPPSTPGAVSTGKRSE
jgi:hypothetical protein